MKREIRWLVVKAVFVAVFILLLRDASAQQQPSLANPKTKVTTPVQKKPTAPVLSTVRSGAIQAPKEKPKGVKSLADAEPLKKPAQRVSRYPSLAVLRDVASAYYGTIATELDALGPEFADDVAVIEAAFKRLQKTTDPKEADQLLVKVSYLLTSVSPPFTEHSTLDMNNISSVARDLRSLKVTEQK